jgi:hypothetical protein
MAETDSARTDELPEGLPLEVVHDELIRIESHWTAQVQNQQTRILAILTVNSFALAFLTAAGFRSTGHGTGFELFGASLIVLTVALIVGIAGLLPRPQRPQLASRPDFFEERLRWLDSRWVWEKYEAGHPARSPLWLFELCESVAQNENWNRDHRRVMRLRGRVMRVQLAFILAGLGILVAAIGYRI